MEQKYRQMIEQRSMGRWAVKRLRHLLEHDRATLNRLESNGELAAHLTLLDEEAEDAFRRAMEEARGPLTEQTPYPEREAVLRSAAMNAESQILRDLVLTLPSA